MSFNNNSTFACFEKRMGYLKDNDICMGQQYFNIKINPHNL